MTIAVPELNIRPFELDDLAAVSGIEEACFDDPYPEYFFRQLSEANPATFLVALREKVLVGYAIMDRWADHYHLVSIAVHPEHRRRGVAQLLMTRLESLLASGRIIRLEVRKNNKPAIAFYTKNGYNLAGVEEHYYRDGEDALIMEKTHSSSFDHEHDSGKRGTSLLVS